MKTTANDGEAPFQPATAGRVDVGSLPLGSAASRAVARRLLERRETEENQGLRFQSFDIVTGEPIDLESRARATEKKLNAAAGIESHGVGARADRNTE